MTNLGPITPNLWIQRVISIHITGSIIWRSISLLLQHKHPIQWSQMNCMQRQWEWNEGKHNHRHIGTWDKCRFVWIIYGWTETHRLCQLLKFWIKLERKSQKIKPVFVRRVCIYVFCVSVVSICCVLCSYFLFWWLFK